MEAQTKKQGNGWLTGFFLGLLLGITTTIATYSLIVIYTIIFKI